MKCGLFRLALLGLVTVASGCIAATSVRTCHISAADRELVAVNEQVYVVDKATGEVMLIDVTSARPFERELEEEED
jgi:hypothetical protein